MGIFRRRSRTVTFADPCVLSRTATGTESNVLEKSNVLSDAASEAFCGGFLLLLKRKRSSCKQPTNKHALVQRDCCLLKEKLGERVSTATTEGSNDGESFTASTPDEVAVPTVKNGYLCPIPSKQTKKRAVMSSPCRSIISCLSFVTCLEIDGDMVEEVSKIPCYQEAVGKCTCGYECHYKTFSLEYPLRKNPGLSSVEESVLIGRSLVGHWVTLLDRSDAMDAQFRLLGLNVMKRAVMNRIAIPMTCFLENEEKDLKCWLHTPIGVRTMMCSLHGNMSLDDDPDCGQWEGTAAVVDHSISWFCNATSIRALQQTRTSKKLGVVIDTRCVLPDAKEGKVMYYNITMIPKADPTKRVSSDRILKYIGPPKLDV